MTGLDNTPEQARARREAEREARVARREAVSAFNRLGDLLDDEHLTGSERVFAKQPGLLPRLVVLHEVAQGAGDHRKVFYLALVQRKGVMLTHAAHPRSSAFPVLRWRGRERSEVDGAELTIKTDGGETAWSVWWDAESECARIEQYRTPPSADRTKGGEQRG